MYHIKDFRDLISWIESGTQSRLTTWPTSLASSANSGPDQHSTLSSKEKRFPKTGRQKASSVTEKFLL
jgi:hypothetical protein